MKYEKMYHLTLQQIHIFLKCYEECNYSAVALKYSYTPSAISKLIHTMEELLGYKLFIKDKKNLKPSVEADILAAQWMEMIEKFESGLDEINKVHGNIYKGVRLGVLSNAEFSKLYVEDRLETNLSAEIRDKIVWGRKDMSELLAALNEDLFDIIVVTSRMVLESGLQLKNMKTIFSAPDAVLIPYAHPLFNKKIDSFADFRDYAFILLDPALYPENYSLLFDLARKHGFTHG